MTKASFDTIGGLLVAILSGILAKQDYEDGDWWMLAMHVFFIVAGIWVFDDGYKNLPKR